MNPEDFIVFIVDDDARMREALVRASRVAGLARRRLRIGRRILSHADKPDLPACLILDVELPDINGLDFQKQISRRRSSADRVPHRARRHSIVRARDQARRGRFPHEAVHGARICSPRSNRRSTRDRRARQRARGARASSGSVSPALRPVSAKCCRWSSAACSTSRRPRNSASARSRSRFIAARSCRRWRRPRSPIW